MQNKHPEQPPEAAPRFLTTAKNVEWFHIKSHQNVQVGQSAFFGAGIIAL